MTSGFISHFVNMMQNMLRQNEAILFIWDFFPCRHKHTIKTALLNQHKSTLNFFLFVLLEGAKQQSCFLLPAIFLSNTFLLQTMFEFQASYIHSCKSEIIFNGSSLCSLKEIYQPPHSGLSAQLVFFSPFQCYTSRWVVFKHASSHFKDTECTLVWLFYWSQRFIIFSRVWLQMRWFEISLRV